MREQMSVELTPLQQLRRETKEDFQSLVQRKGPRGAAYVRLFLDLACPAKVHRTRPMDSQAPKFPLNNTLARLQCSAVGGPVLVAPCFQQISTVTVQYSTVQ